MREDWIECKLEDLLDYEQPTKYIIQEEKYNDEFPIPVLTAGKSFIKGYTNEDFGIFDNLPTIIFDDFTTASQFVNFKFKVKSSAMKILVPTSKLVNLKFAFGAMQVNNVRSETHKRYWISEYSKLSIGLPPLVEQRAIVQKLESLFSSLDAGVADLKKAQQQLKIYRQAVLKKAFEGELMKYNLSDYLIKIEAGKSFKCKETTPSVDEIGILKISAVTWGEFNELESKTVEDLTKININYFVNPGDFLMSRANTLELVGNSVIVNNISRKLMLSDKTLRLKFTSEIIPKYVLYFLSSKDGKGQIMSLSTGNQESMRNISQSGINKIKIPVPQSIEQQKEIVNQIESRLSVCDFIEQNIKESLTKAEALRQSILKKAFEGNLLTTQELAECKLAKDYEPAGVLLERIKAEQNKATAKPSKKKQSHNVAKYE